MFGQTFEAIDLARLAALALIEIVLSADNAVVLGLLSYELPPEQRRKALLIGLISAFFLRAAAIFTLSFFLNSRWLQLLGAAYLVYLCIRHFLQKRKRKRSVPSQPSFWKTVLLIEFFDLAFAIDSIIAGIAFIAPSKVETGIISPKLWIVYFGGMIGIVAIRFAAEVFSHLLERFPHLEDAAYLLVAAIALKLVVAAEALPFPGFEMIFWIVFVLILGFGFFQTRKPT